MKNEYDIESLRKTFLRHNEEWIKQNEELKKKYPPENEIITEDFSVSLALHHICDEIIKLKENRK